MTDQELKELNEKLAKWRWPDAKQIWVNNLTIIVWVKLGEIKECKLFTYSTDACFKWLEPPLYERFGIYHIGFARVVGVGYNCYMNRCTSEWPWREEGQSKELTTLGHSTTLGGAFCEAAWQVIHKYSELIKPLNS